MNNDVTNLYRAEISDCNGLPRSEEIALAKQIEPMVELEIRLIVRRLLKQVRSRLILQQPLMLETYPGYPTRRVAYDDLPDLEMIICDMCGYVVSQDEFVECSTCNMSMCLYCYQSTLCPEANK